MTYRIYNGYTMTYQDSPSDEFFCMLDTGKIDSKGNSIYECDIVTEGDYRGIVEHGDNGFILRRGVKVTPLGQETQTLTVVGNAFENPELL